MSLGSSRPPAARCGVCVNTLGSGRGAGDRKDWRDLWHRSPAPGSGGGARPRLISRPALRYSRGSFPRLDCGCRPRGNRRQNADPVLDARRALSAPGADHFWNSLRHARKSCRRRLRWHIVRQLLSGPWVRWVLGVSFLSVAVWALFPDKYEGGDRTRRCIRDNSLRFFPLRNR
jgi:hypothetical protein